MKIQIWLTYRYVALDGANPKTPPPTFLNGQGPRNHGAKILLFSYSREIPKIYTHLLIWFQNIQAGWLIFLRQVCACLFRNWWSGLHKIFQHLKSLPLPHLMWMVGCFFMCSGRVPFFEFIVG